MTTDEVQSALELAIVGANPVVTNDEQARQIVSDLFAAHRNTSVEGSNDTDYVIYASGLDIVNLL
jgi:alpha-galactosidase/6-phospho-beta-glucosidase family protein